MLADLGVGGQTNADQSIFMAAGIGEASETGERCDS
jgi:hypothetical protein